MRSVYIYIFIAWSLLCLTACQDRAREPEGALQMALEALNQEDYDTYLKHVDFGAEMDSAQEAFMRDALKQYLEWQRSEYASVMSIDIVDAKMRGDSICTVYYQYTFADGKKEVSSQKMVRQGEVWKIRLRN